MKENSRQKIGFGARFPPIRLVLVVILALGVFFRLYGLGERNLWTDEAWVALAALQEHPAAVIEEGQSTPPLYLLAVWAWAHWVGKSEAVLRLTSCLFGIGTLFLGWRLARRLLSPGAALAALTAIAVSPRLVYYSKELKQYSADAFFAVLALVLTERLLRQPGPRDWVTFTLAIAIGLGFSHSLVFIVPVAVAILWWRRPEARRCLIVASGILLLVFLGCYFLFFRHQVDPELVAYWQQDFPDLSSLGALGHWFAAALARYLGYFLGDWPRWLIGAGVLSVGMAALLQGPHPRTLLYWLGPLVMALAAAFLHRYPFMAHYGGVRLMLYSAPMLFLIVGAGVMVLAGWIRRERRIWLTFILIVGIVLWTNPVRLWQENLYPQTNREEIHPLIDYLEASLQPGDLVYVYYFAIYPFKFYYEGPEAPVVWGRSCHDQHLTLPPGCTSPARLWLLFSHFEQSSWIEQFSQRLLGAGWQRILQRSRPGAALFCYTWQPHGAAAPQTVNPSRPGPS